MSPRYKTRTELEYTLWQVPCKQNSLSMAYVIKSSDGLCFVIDGGSADDAGVLESFILEKCGDKVDAWFITRTLATSAGALLSILKNENRALRIQKIVYAHVSPAEIEKYSEEMASFTEDFNLTVRVSGCQRINVHTGERIKLERALIRVFSSPDAGIEEDYICNASVVYKFNLSCTSILFLSGIGREAATLLLENYKNELSCDFLQITGCTACKLTEDIYRLASPDTCLWCANREQWQYDGDIMLARNQLDSYGVTEHKISDSYLAEEIKITC